MTIAGNILALFTPIFGASGMAYMYSQPRYELTQKTNCVVAGYPSVWELRSDDAGNWTGCAIGAGQLIGTCRDWSACAESAKLGRAVTPQELYNLGFGDVAKRMTEIFDSLGLNQLSNQDVANITMHVGMHFGVGNFTVVQRALNDLGESITVDGNLGTKTLDALKRQTKKNPGRTYNAIRSRLEEAYTNASPAYQTGFLSNMKHFPPKSETPTWIWWAIAAVVIVLIIFLILFVL